MIDFYLHWIATEGAKYLAGAAIGMGFAIVLWWIMCLLWDMLSRWWKSNG